MKHGQQTKLEQERLRKPPTTPALRFGRNLAYLAATLLCLAAGFAAEEKQKPVKAEVGQEFKLTLESNPSSGNQWVLARPLDARLLKFLGTEYRRGRGGAPDATGHEILSFRALAEGNTEIFLKYGRLLEQDVAPARKTNFVVVITRPGAR